MERADAERESDFLAGERGLSVEDLESDRGVPLGDLGLLVDERGVDVEDLTSWVTFLTSSATVVTGGTTSFSEEGGVCSKN